MPPVRLRRPVYAVTAPAPLRRLPAVLLRWYDENRRDLPWRHQVSPYRTWVSEIMLQQTRVAAAEPYFLHFMAAFPTIADLAKADTEQVLRLWQGLGYYSRARNLQKAAREIMERHGGVFPDTYEAIAALPGIGDYTAGAILSIAFGQPYPAVDGNVLRILSRLTACGGNVLDTATRTTMRAWLSDVLPTDRPGDMNQALMDLGATVCLSHGRPLCESCPAAEFCAAHALGREQDFPVRVKKTSRKTEVLTAFLLLRNGEIALRQRPDRGLLASLWEVPHTAGELDEQQASEWLLQNGVIPHQWVKKIHWKHLFTHIAWQITGYIVEIQGDGDSTWLWCGPEERSAHPVPSAFSPLIKEIDNGTALL